MVGGGVIDRHWSCRAGPGAGIAPARAAPSAAGRASLPPSPAAASQAPASLDSAGSVACNDFDALLNQLQFPGVGPATSGAAGAHPSGGFDALGAPPRTTTTGPTHPMRDDHES